MLITDTIKHMMLLMATMITVLNARCTVANGQWPDTPDGKCLFLRGQNGVI